MAIALARTCWMRELGASGHALTPVLVCGLLAPFQRLKQDSQSQNTRGRNDQCVEVDRSAQKLLKSWKRAKSVTATLPLYISNCPNLVTKKPTTKQRRHQINPNQHAPRPGKKIKHPQQATTPAHLILVSCWPSPTLLRLPLCHHLAGRTGINEATSRCLTYRHSRTTRV